MSRLVVTRANLVILGVVILMVSVIGGLAWERQSAAQRAHDWVAHTDDVIHALDAFEGQLLAAETGQRGFLLTGSPDYLIPYQSALDQIALLQSQLQQLTLDNQGQQLRLQALAPVVRDELGGLRESLELRRTGGPEAAIRAFGTRAGRELLARATELLREMQQEEQRLLGLRETVAARDLALETWMVIGLTVLAVAMLLAAARWLTQAWRQAESAEARQRSLAIRLRTSLDSLSQGLGVFDASFVLVDWNECFRVLLHLPQEIRLGTTSYAELAGCVSDLLETEAQVRGTRPESVRTVVHAVTRTDGRELELRRTSMSDGGFVLTVSDMTARAQAEAVLRESQKMQAIGQLTGGIAHDFNNLLTVVLGSLEFICGHPDDRKRVLVRAERAVWAAQRGATLTRQLLAFARKQPLAPAALDLTTVVPELVPLLRRTLGEDVDVRYVEPAGLWPAMADPAQLESAVLNLALNARDAMASGGRLTIELANAVLDADYAARHAEVEPGDYTMLAVSDTGHGMPPTVAARAFEPFFTTKSDGKGSGLGLAMVFGFAKQSGGHVKIYSEVGEGTAVRLYLPRATVRTAPPVRPADLPELPRGSATLLLVEDDPAVREIASAMLTELGYRVLEAKDGLDALAVFEVHGSTVDLVLTDVVLPGALRGRDVATRIRALRPEIGLLFMSGYTENSIVHDGRLDDGVELISKPFTRERLAQKVAEVLARS